jgi:hypothetical protein
MAHPILRIVWLKYREGSAEQRQMLRFLNAQCIKQRFESEEDYFGGDLTKQTKKHLIELEPFSTSTWAQTPPMSTRWMEPLL